ncbi:MAG: hypothetical protein Q4D51_05605 [Eubacteriales bacterium]|nr:hypothetical protein [Eubacteriales bacterium]
MNEKEPNIYKEIKQSLSKLNRDKIEKAAIVVLFGVFLLLIATPVSSVSDKRKQSKNDDTTSIPIEVHNEKKDAYIACLENKLEQTIEGMEGAGTAHVMITLKDNGEKILDKNLPYENEVDKEKADGKETERTKIQSNQETVLIEQDGDTTPIVIQERYPEIEGVVVVCDGGNNAVLALHIKEAIQALFSIDAHKIVVCKAKK